MRELGRLFRTMCSTHHTAWAKHVPEIECMLNVATHMSTGFAPYELHFGRSFYDKVFDIIKFPLPEVETHEARMVLARENLIRSFNKRKKAQKGISTVKLCIGDLVLLRVPHLSNANDRVVAKFFHLYEGPFRILQTRGTNAFLLGYLDNDKGVKGTFNRLSLRKYHEPTENCQ